MKQHTENVWENFISRAPARNICIVAHSCGGVCSLHIIKTFFREVVQRVKGIALLDSVHKTVAELNIDQRKFFEKTAKNWKKSQKPLGTKVSPGRDEGCACVSAGDPRHEYTAASSFPEVFPFLESKLQNKKRHAP